MFRDVQGSVLMVANAAGAPAEPRRYHPFGEMANTDKDITLPEESKGWIGERYDAGAGLQYLNARYYDPKLAMFIQPDWFEVTKKGRGYQPLRLQWQQSGEWKRSGREAAG